MKITMDKKWAQRQDPTKEVRVLCVDSGHKDYPVVYLDKSGAAITTTADGLFYRNEGEDEDDLVPLQEKVADVWVVVRGNGTRFNGIFDSEDGANKFIELAGATTRKPYRVVRMTQAEEKS